MNRTDKAPYCRLARVLALAIALLHGQYSDAASAYRGPVQVQAASRLPRLLVEAVEFPLSPAELHRIRQQATMYDYTPVALDRSLRAPLDADGSVLLDVWQGVSMAGVNWDQWIHGRSWSNLYVELVSTGDLEACLEGLVRTNSTIGLLWLRAEPGCRLSVDDVPPELCAAAAKLVGSLVMDLDELTVSALHCLKALRAAGVARLGLKCTKIGQDVDTLGASDFRLDWLDLQAWGTGSEQALQAMAPEFVRMPTMNVGEFAPLVGLIDQMGARMELCLRSDGTTWPDFSSIDGILGMTLELGGVPWSGNYDSGWIEFVKGLPGMSFLKLKQGGDWGEEHIVRAEIGYRFQRLELEEFGELQFATYGCAPGGALVCREVFAPKDAEIHGARIDPSVLTVYLQPFARAAGGAFVSSRLGPSTKVCGFTYGHWDDIHGGIRANALTLDTLRCSATAMTRAPNGPRSTPAKNVYLHDCRSGGGCEWLADLNGATTLLVSDMELDVAGLIKHMPESVTSLWLLRCSLRIGNGASTDEAFAMQWLTLEGCKGDSSAFRLVAAGKYGTFDMRGQQAHADLLTNSLASEGRVLR